MAVLDLLLCTVAIVALHGLWRICYNLFFHPLRKFPGPVLAGATSGWKAYKEVIKQETIAQELFDLHKRYGKVMSQTGFLNTSDTLFYQVKLFALVPTR